MATNEGRRPVGSAFEEAGSSTRPFNQSLPMMLMKAREGVMRRFRPHLRSHGLTDQQWRILRALAEENRIELLELSNRCMIQPPSLSRTVPALAERGLVFREDHPSDRRRTLVSLTDEGRELFEVMSAESARIYQQLTDDIGGAEKLAEIYRLLRELIDEVEGSAGDDVAGDAGAEG
jgi:homoprotocatechuate degradation regulator HpaR